MSCCQDLIVFECAALVIGTYSISVCFKKKVHTSHAVYNILTLCPLDFVQLAL